MAKYTGCEPEFKNQCESASKSRPGERCRQKAQLGGNVCYYHGGGSPQVQESNRVRLAALVSPSINVLHGILTSPASPTNPRSLKARVAWDMLDRNGYQAQQDLVISHEFDQSRFGYMTDEEIQALLTLAKKATVGIDAATKTDGPAK